MWRKNQGPQTPAPVPAKNQPSKVEVSGTLASKPETSKPQEFKPESSQAPERPAASVIPPAAAAAPTGVPAFKPATAAPVVTPAAMSAALPGNADSRIGAGLKIRGEITGTSDTYIDGDVQGKVRVGSGRLTIGPNGRVQADLEAREIVVNGTVVGNLKATDRVQLGSSGSVQGGVTTPRIGIEDGARLRGNVETARAGESASSGAKSSEKEDLRALVATKGE